MVIPFDEDQPKHESSPVTYGLIAVNVLVFALVFLGSGHPGETLHAWAFDPKHPNPVKWLTSIFLHAGFGHLLGNMIFLRLCGRPLEWRLGRAGFLALYFASGLIATIVQSLASPLLSLGASGAIAGLMGAGAVVFPWAQVRLFYFWAYRFGTFECSAVWLLAYWILEQVVCMKLFGDAAGVAFAAHLGGFAGGLALVFAVLRFFRAPEHVAEEQERRIQRATGRAFEPTIARTPIRALPRPALDATARRAQEAQERAEERAATRTAVRAALVRGETDRVVRLYEQAELMGDRPVLPAEEQELLAFFLTDAHRATLARRALEDLVRVHAGTPEAHRAVRALRAARRTSGTTGLSRPEPAPIG